MRHPNNHVWKLCTLSSFIFKEEQEKILYSWTYMKGLGNIHCYDRTAMFILLALFIALVEPSSVEEECTLHRLQACLESLQTISQGSDLALAATREELMTVCNTLKASVSCVDQHMQHCFTSTQRKVFNHVVSGARQFLKELCVPGKTQETYLQHSPCYRNVSLSEDKCAKEYKHLIQISEQVDEERDVDEGLKQSCCAFNAFVQCKHIHARTDCGRDAAHFLQEHLDRISNPLIHEHCEHYMHERDACFTSASYVPQSISVLMTALFSNVAMLAFNFLLKDVW